MEPTPIEEGLADAEMYFYDKIKKLVGKAVSKGGSSAYVHKDLDSESKGQVQNARARMNQFSAKPQLKLQSALTTKPPTTTGSKFSRQNDAYQRNQLGSYADKGSDSDQDPPASHLEQRKPPEQVDFFGDQS